MMESAWVSLFIKNLRYDNTLEMGHNNGGTRHW
jgi:hypothetical protein